MKTKKLLLIALSFIALTSCKKEGCTDMDAKNYNAEADVNDNTCTYEGSNVLWYDQTASQGLINDGATSLTFYVNGQIVGSTGTNVYWTAAPNCGDTGSITVLQDLGDVKSLSYSYSVEDQTGWVYWSGVLNFTANTCTGVQLSW